jgi:hypothetical protein
VSGFVKSNLPIVLVNHITSSIDLRRAFIQSFLEVDQGLAESKVDCEFSGSTCTVAYLKVSCASGHEGTNAAACQGASRGKKSEQGHACPVLGNGQLHHMLTKADDTSYKQQTHRCLYLLVALLCLQAEVPSSSTAIASAKSVLLHVEG